MGFLTFFRTESFGCEKCPLNHPSIFKVQSSTFELFQRSLEFHTSNPSLRNPSLSKHPPLELALILGPGCCQSVEPTSRPNPRNSSVVESRTQDENPKIDGFICCFLGFLGFQLENRCFFVFLRHFGGFICCFLG